MNNKLLQGILLLGGGGHCKAVIDVLSITEKVIAGIVHGIDAPFEPVLGHIPLGRDDDLIQLRQSYSSALITVGQVKNSAVRKKLFATLCQLDFAIPTVVSKLAYVSAFASIGAGTVVMHQAIVNAAAIIGENCIINTCALVEHDCIISPHCHIAVGAILCGGVCVGEGSFVGAGSIIREGIQLGKNVIIGCGTVIQDNVAANMCIKGKFSEKMHCYSRSRS